MSATEGAARYCKWVRRDDEGRPWCEHGRAIKSGASWTCGKKAVDRVRRYRQTVAGRKVAADWNRSEHGRSSKAVYDLTRVRIGGLYAGTH